MKKWLILIIIVLAFPLATAMNLDISEKPLSNTIISELDEPAVFELTLRNLEKTDTFEIYSVIGLEISPDEPFTIQEGDKKTLTVEVKVPDTLRTKGRRAFEYKIKNSKNEIEERQFVLNIINLDDALIIIPENINPGTDSTSFSIKNTATFELDLSINLNSAFFDQQIQLSLKPSETREIEIPIEQEKMKTLSAGNYLTNIEIKVQNQKLTKEIIIRFLEQEGIDTQETDEGFLITRKEITKKNVGNMNKEVEITAEKNILSYLFTTLNTEPTEISFQGAEVRYIWKKELIPNEELKIIIKTNWFYPIIIIIFIILIIYLIKMSVEMDLILRKKVSFVKTRGGQFALKITLKLKAKKFIERINIVDKLPHLVKIYERFGAVPPDKIDLRNRRLEWNIGSLNKGEERIFTYIIYSKIGVVGRFELPEAKAIYEKEGRIKSSTSNRSFYINEPKE